MNERDKESEERMTSVEREGRKEENNHHQWRGKGLTESTDVGERGVMDQGTVGLLAD